MSDARWIEIEADAKAANDHFCRAVALFELGGFDADDIRGYQARMAFMHAMQAGHTSLERCLIRILEMLDEERPAGESWHADLISRVSAPRSDVRPAILSGAVSTAADETRRFRAVATRGYDTFEPSRSMMAVDAARLLAAELLPTLLKFRRDIDGGRR
jgi:hypothetical protein